MNIKKNRNFKDIYVKVLINFLYEILVEFKRYLLGWLIRDLIFLK